MSTSISSAMAARECLSSSKVMGSISTSWSVVSDIGLHQQVSSGQDGCLVTWQQANGRAWFEHDAWAAHPVARLQAVTQDVLDFLCVDGAPARQRLRLPGALR